MNANAPRSISERVKLAETMLRVWQKRGEAGDVEHLREFAERQELSEPVVRAMWLELHAQDMHEVQIIVPLEVADKGGVRGQLCKVRLVLAHGLEGAGRIGGWVMGADTASRLAVRPSFEESLDKARAALNALDPDHPLWPVSDPATVFWHCEDLACGTELSGGSAGCMIAIGLVELFRKAGCIPKEHRLAASLQWKAGAPLGRFTASAQIDSRGYLAPVNDEALDSKLDAPGIQKLEYFLVSRAQRKEEMSAAAASGSREVPVANLQEALWFIAAHLGEQPGLKSVKPVRWKRWTAVLVILVLFAISGYNLCLRYPAKWALDFKLPREVSIDSWPVPPDCAHSIYWAADSNYIWRTRIEPTLKHVNSPLAIALGSLREFHGFRSGNTLIGFGELSSIRCLALLHSEIDQLEGAENLRDIVRFADLGGRVLDLEWLTKSSHLKVLVLDSGFLEHYPALDFPELQTLLIHVPDHWKGGILDLSPCPKLRRLAVCGDGLKEIQGLDRLADLEELIVYSDGLQKFEIAPSNHISRLELARAGEIDVFDLDVFPMLKSLELKDTSIRGIHGQTSTAQLETIKIEDAPDLKSLDLTGLVNLRQVEIRDAPLDELKSLATAQGLHSLSLNGTHLNEVKGLVALKSLEKLEFKNDSELTSLDVSGLTHLREMQVNGAPLSRVVGLGDLRNLKILTLSHCPLNTIAGLEHLLKLQEADLSSAPLENTPPLTELASLFKLDLSNTHLTNLPVLGASKACWVLMNQTPFQANHPDGNEWVWGTDKAGKRGYAPGTGYYEDFPIDTYAYQIHRPDGRLVDVDLDGWEEKEITPPPPVFHTKEILVSWDAWSELALEDIDFGGSGGWEKLADPSETRMPSGQAKPGPRSPFHKLLGPEPKPTATSDIPSVPGRTRDESTGPHNANEN